MTALPATSSDYYSRACECAMTVEVTKLYRLINTCDVRARCADEYVCVCVCARARALDESAAGRQSSRVCLVLGVRLINASDHRPTGRYRPHTTRQLILTLTLTIHFLQYSAIQQVFEMTFDDSISIMSSASRFSAT